MPKAAKIRGTDFNAVLKLVQNIDITKDMNQFIQILEQARLKAQKLSDELHKSKIKNRRQN